MVRAISECGGIPLAAPYENYKACYSNFFHVRFGSPITPFIHVHGRPRCRFPVPTTRYPSRTRISHGVQ